MKSYDGKKYVYEKQQLIEVICQLRFPTILSIDTDVPSAFQETIRARFPRYEVHDENLPTPNGLKKQKSHAFISADGGYKLTLTQSFIALSTMRYTGWEDFASWLDEPLMHFINVYKPAFFERIGLRYVNGFSRDALGLADRRWNDLIQPKYLGVLDDDEVDEASVLKCSSDVELKLSGGCAVKLHAGPGFVKRAVRTPKGLQQIQEPKPRFIFDQDLYCAGKLDLQAVPATLGALHDHADRLFSEAITDVLHNAMEPVVTD